MNVVVTGGAGFIGSNLADALIAQGHAVTVIDDLSRGHREWVTQGAEFLELSVVDPSLSQALKQIKPEVIFHLAAQMDVRFSVANPVSDATTNVVGGVNLMQAAVDAGARRVVFASSGGTVYGDTDVIPTPEDHPLRPASAYGCSKVACEVYGQMFAQLHGLEFVSLRYGNVYGPRQDPHGEAGVVAIFSQKLLDGIGPTVNGDGLNTRDYIYVDDVVSANLAAISCPQGAYNVGTGTETNVNQIYEAIAKDCGISAAAVHGPAKPGEQRRSCLDISRVKAELGWEPTTTLDHGIAQTVAWFRARKPVAAG
jgi:UDP-glucose 4-epimerase